MSYTCKVKYGSDIRYLVLPDNSTSVASIALMRKGICGIHKNVKPNFILKYLDCDGDLVTVVDGDTLADVHKRTVVEYAKRTRSIPLYEIFASPDISTPGKRKSKKGPYVKVAKGSNTDGIPDNMIINKDTMEIAVTFSVENIGDAPLPKNVGVVIAGKDKTSFVLSSLLDLKLGSMGPGETRRVEIPISLLKNSTGGKKFIMMRFIDRDSGRTFGSPVRASVIF
jgi:hypothetical protein